jgi:hypothetical protein
MLGEHWRWLFGHMRPLHVDHRRAVYFPFFDSPSKELLEIPISDLCSFGPVALDLIGDIGLNVLSHETLDLCWHSIIDKKEAESLYGVRVTLNGLRRFVGGSQ